MDILSVFIIGSKNVALIKMCHFQQLSSAFTAGLQRHEKILERFIVKRGSTISDACSSGRGGKWSNGGMFYEFKVTSAEY